MGMMKEFDIRIRNGGDDAIAAVAELWESREKILFDITDAFTKARWIPVDERLPEGDEPEAVLGWNGIRVREVVFCPRCKEGDQWSSFGGHEYVTHWMPLPEPPETK